MNRRLFFASSQAIVFRGATISLLMPIPLQIFCADKSSLNDDKDMIYGESSRVISAYWDFDAEGMSCARRTRWVQSIRSGLSYQTDISPLLMESTAFSSSAWSGRFQRYQIA